MISIIITAWKEEKTIGKAINSLVNPNWNDYKDKFEIIIVCPDDKTWIKAKETADRFRFVNIKRVKDPKKGKPTALNLAFKEAKGEILILTDGDVYFSKNVISRIFKFFKDPKVGGVTGRPISLGKKDSFMQFANHFYADVAHHKRMVTMRNDVSGRSLKVVSKKPRFFILSGYISAIRNIPKLHVPEDCLIDDAYLSYLLHNEGYKLRYEPNAVVFVKYAQNLTDWYRQKLRSVGGYEQLWKYGVITKHTKVRNFWKELEYAIWYPFTYVKGIKQALWALFLYPTRLLLWIRIFWQQRIMKKGFAETWVRIESTK